MADTHHPASAACPNCNHEPPAQSSFCNRCGSPMAEVPILGERRPLTVMFCDLVGSTELAQALDAEELPLVIAEYQNACAQIIREFEGHIAEFLGDGILVYFGYPHAHEDDAIRAANAALAMMSVMPTLNVALAKRLPAFVGRTIEMRIGIHSGPVVLSDMGRGAEAQRLGVGDTLNTAARIQASALPNNILISESTQRLVSGAFDLQSLGATRLKGIAKPIELFTVEAAQEDQSRFERSAQAGLTPLVGRQQEVALALERWEQVKGGHGQAVLLSGEPGIGKSRLVSVVRDRIGDELHRWLTCRCTAHRENTAFYPVQDMLERMFEIEDGDSHAQRRAKVEAGLGAAQIHADRIPPLVNLLTGPGHRGGPRAKGQGEDPRSQILEALAACIAHLSLDRPLVLVFEDIHWIDPSTLELLGLLLARTGDERVLLLLTCRPEFEVPWEAGQQLVHIQLNSLTRDQVAELCTAVAGGRSLPDELLAELVAKADGIPFFAEELTKTVLEADWLEESDGRLRWVGPRQRLAVPSTLSESLMARLDGQGATKELAQLCAVIGRESSYDLLRVVSELPEKQLQSGLRSLVDANLIASEGQFQQRRYVFCHALIHDTAYDSLLRSDRQDLHLRIARVLEERFPGVGISRPEDLARHFARGGDVASAVPLYHRAAKQAIERLAHVEAIGHLTTAIEFLGMIPTTAKWEDLELQMQIELGTSSMLAEGQGHERVEQCHARARDLSLKLMDEKGLFRALWGLSRFHQSRGNTAASHSLGQQMLELAEGANDPALLSWAHLALGQAQFWRGDPRGALANLNATVAYRNANPNAPDEYMFGQDPLLTARALLGSTEFILGHVDHALTHGREGVEAASKSGDPFTHAFVLNFAATVHQMRGERAQVLERAEAAIDICGERGFPLFMGMGLVMKGWAQCVNPEDESGLEMMQRGLAYFQDAHTGLGGPYLLALLSEALRVVGRENEALAAIETALGLAQSQESHFWDPDLLRLKSEILLAVDAGATAQSEELLRSALDMARQRGAVSFELRAAMSLYHLLEGSEPAGEALDAVRTCFDRFEEGFETHDLREAKALLSAN